MSSRRISKGEVLGLVCLVVGLSAFFVAYVPRQEVPLNDEWCYLHLAQVFHTRHTVELGGCSAVIPITLYVASEQFVRIFGSSILSLRLALLLFAILAVLFMHGLSRRLGLSAGAALFVSAALIFSPLAIPNVLLFMTDIPAVAMLLGGTFFLARSAANGCHKRDLLIALLFYAAGVLTRQLIVIYAALSFCALPWIVDRPWRRTWAAGVAALLICAVFQGVSIWSQARPDHVTGASDLRLTVAGIRDLRGYIAVLSKTVVTLFAYLLPAVLTAAVGLAAELKKFRRPHWTVWPLVGAFAILLRYGAPFPRLGNMVTEFGFLYPGFMGLGSAPEVLTHPVRWLVTLVSAAAAFLWLACYLPKLTALLCSFFARSDDQRGPEIRSARILAVQVIASVLFVLLTASRYLWWVGDRYFLLPLPFLLLLMLRAAPTPPRAAYVVSGVLIAAFAAFSSLSLADYVRQQVARRVVAAELAAAGYSRNEILVGWEQDHAWEIASLGSMDYAHRGRPPIHQGYAPSYFRAIVPRIGVVVGEAPSSSLVEPACYVSRLAARRLCVFALELSATSLRRP